MRSILLALPLLTATPVTAQTFTTLRPFGYPEQSAAHPDAGPILGNDATLYGTTFGGGRYNAGTVYKVGLGGSGFTVLRHFSADGVNGLRPGAPLVWGRENDGLLYGTTASGGDAGAGTVFRLDKNGGGFLRLHSFSTNGGDGTSPYGALIQGGDYSLYGVTYSGGDHGGGTLFKLETDGAGYGVLLHFGGTNGRAPSSVIEGADGFLYGTTIYGGTNDCGTLFRIARNGTGFSVLRNFVSSDGDGQFPQPGLMQASDGLLYGVCEQGGSNGCGTIFRISTNGTGYATLKHFDAYDGPVSLTEGNDGLLYGTTGGGGSGNYGLVFRMDRDGLDYRVLSSFSSSDGQSPRGPMVQGSDGTFYGTAYYGGSRAAGVVFSSHYYAAGFNTLGVLWNFDVLCGDLYQPEAGLLEGRDGALYGTTFYGGAQGRGGVYRLDRTGANYALLMSFAGTNGDSSRAVLSQGADGMLYGTTVYGGTNGCGAVFKLGTNGAGFAVLRHLGATGDGRYPQAGVVAGGDGYLYGTTLNGGSNGVGTVFKVNTNGTTFVVLRHFLSGGSDGALPYAGLLEGSGGILYGVTSAGGSNNQGTVFRLDKKNGSAYTTLYHFKGGTDGGSPRGTLSGGGDGILYGTTFSGGSSNAGTVFRLRTDGAGYERIWNFHPATGTYPKAGVIEGRDGQLYGTTSSDGGAGWGSLFWLYKDGSGYRVMKSFGAGSGGQNPHGLLAAGDGAIYGTTAHGSDMTGGNVYKLVPPPVGRFTRIRQTAGGGFALDGRGETNRAYMIQSTTNLLNASSWKSVATNSTDGGGAVSFSDTPPTSTPRRIYRLRLP